MSIEIYGATEQQKRTVLDWKAAAIADGWTCEPTYHGESEDRACRLWRDGYLVSVIAREPQDGRFKSEYSLHAWCPKGIALEIPIPYSFEALAANTRRCSWCKREDMETVRVAFADRVCLECEPAARKKLEYPGWNR